MKREKWLMDREQDLMPVKYFHTVFTVPEQVNDLFVHYPVPLYNLLFTSAWETIRQFGLDHKHLGAKTGMVAILHTWGQNLAFHPHVHCIKNVQEGEVTFSWFNYRTTKAGELTPTAVEFLRRFAMHILPPGFMKIRHYGILGARNKKTALAAIRNFLGVKAPESTKQMDWKAVFEMKFGHDPAHCPVCRNGQMQRVASVMAPIRGSPKLDFEPNIEFYNQK
ncbi:MAG: transposase [Breznakibacter sp.]|nr:transposase [Breznakibacter sp.]